MTHVFDVILELVEELSCFVVIYEVRDTHTAAVVSYIVNLINVVETLIQSVSQTLCVEQHQKVKQKDVASKLQKPINNVMGKCN